ncbi:hypothetical protein [Hymenobacter mucosus]|uniref:Uncharacterized protein n=1 Tax=Hymenobacter mucosus TaxID=1411120 RepID=A0A238VY99_9BACT|nr:hypothetical protein [Hymenobacter mucosus]SNR39208.1 hypothetical protein SAMN06269173_10237 [Hymenobacter mucosus]
MKQNYFSLAFGLLLCTSCISNREEEYTLPSNLLAWQPYHTGDVLRFGQDRSSKVRTFTITEVNSHFITYRTGGTAPVYLGPSTKIKAQQLDIVARRTDTIQYQPTPTSTPAHPDSVLIAPTTLLSMSSTEYGNHTYVFWDRGFGYLLPLNHVLKGEALYDTTAQLLPTMRLGTIAYDSVLRVSDGPHILPTSPRTKSTRRIYYAKGYGVVGFVEGSTLWYRLQ